MPKPRAFAALEHGPFRRRLDRLSTRIADPVDKLWFIQRTLRAFGEAPALFQRFPALRTTVFYYGALESMGDLVFGSRKGHVAFPTPLLWALYRLRHLALVLTVMLVGSIAFHVGKYGYQKGSEGTMWLADRIFASPQYTVASAPTSVTERIGSMPDDIWLASREGHQELWSNGLRISTTFETQGEPRRFFAFPKDGSPPVLAGPAPVGIVYHTSESDMAPFSKEFKVDILKTTSDLIGWLSRRKIYNYVIDRFGQVYRIVSDESAAVHAGVSIWADDENFYLNLNDSFIGVAFESASSAGGDVVTAAQIQAASNLTDLLRLRYRISDQNCVPHGLVSVNPAKGLIGYHADWARNFPFAALGLSDKYDVPPPSVTAFGFHYDAALVERLGGKLWPGVARAEQELVTRAEKEGLKLAELRSRLQSVYRGKLATAKSRRDSPVVSGGASY
ncbi:MAG TPA: N-acetylmuramoyl-L-alanine amidase [Vicinamibacteria bacterium]|nr:N-acetylmuramoyl-L-alanine amidase [Vicinamibacteria bacterium]